MTAFSSTIFLVKKFDKTFRQKFVKIICETFHNIMLYYAQPQRKQEKDNGNSSIAKG
ncbi:hypothetical protein BSU04nite_14570 [Bacillus spizizenii]|nr:hypothetical protein BSU04nite_14570 [Bacillus spizizenii]